MAVGPTNTHVKSAPVTPSQWVKRTEHEGDNSLIYLLPNLRMSGAASSPPLRCLCDVHGDKSAFSFIFLWKLLKVRHYITLKTII